MAKSYFFRREDILNLLSNHKRAMALKVREFIAAGNDPATITLKQSEQWTAEFFDEEVARGEIKLGDILDKVDQVTEAYLGKSLEEIIKEKRSENPYDS